MIWRIVMLPFALLYGLVTAFRNQLYDIGVLPSSDSPIPSISVGNLSAGGTGKTPMTEFLIRLLGDRYRVATLSRGYGRRTSGYLLAQPGADSTQVGDEPAQFKKKFPEVPVAVCNNRLTGVSKMIKEIPDLQVVLLDDAFQHRRLKPGLSILLTDYGRMFYDDFHLPSGTLREWSSGKKRADVIIVTKCPDNLTPVEKRVIQKKILPQPHQQVFFSYVRYGNAQPLFSQSNSKLFSLELKPEVFLLSGISNPRPLEDHFLNAGCKVVMHDYPDHHEFTLTEIMKLDEEFRRSSSAEKIIVTTEKDAMRLSKKGFEDILSKLPVYFIPIETYFDEKEHEDLNTIITNYLNRSSTKPN